MQPFENQCKSNTNFLILQIMKNFLKMHLAKGSHLYLLNVFELDGTFYFACKKFEENQCIHNKIKEFDTLKSAQTYFNSIAINLIKLS